MSQVHDVIDLIDKALTQKGWNRKDLAAALDVAESTISKSMSKKSGVQRIRLSVETLLEISRVLDVDPRSLVPGTKAISLEDYMKEIARGVVKEELNKK